MRIVLFKPRQANESLFIFEFNPCLAVLIDACMKSDYLCNFNFLQQSYKILLTESMQVSSVVGTVISHYVKVNY